VENFTSNLHGFREAGSSCGDDKEFLKWKLVASMFSTIDDVEARNWKGLWDWVSGNLGIVLPKRNSLDTSSSLGSGKRDCDG
jgi:hypothetical protein